MNTFASSSQGKPVPSTCWAPSSRADSSSYGASRTVTSLTRSIAGMVSLSVVSEGTESASSSSLVAFSTTFVNGEFVPRSEYATRPRPPSTTSKASVEANRDLLLRFLCSLLSSLRFDRYIRLDRYTFKGITFRRTRLIRGPAPSYTTYASKMTYRLQQYHPFVTAP